MSLRAGSTPDCWTAGPPTSHPAQPGDDELIAAAAYKWLRSWPSPGADLWEVPSGWRMGQRAPTTFRLHAGERTDHVYLTGTPQTATAVVEDGESHSLTASLDGDRLAVTLDGLRTDYLVAATDGQIWLSGTRPHRGRRGGAGSTGPPRRRAQRRRRAHQPDAGFGCRRWRRGRRARRRRRRRRHRRGDEDGTRTDRTGRRRGRTTRRRRRPGQGGPAAGPDHRYNAEGEQS